MPKISNEHNEICIKIEKLVAKELKVKVENITCQWNGIYFTVSLPGLRK